MHPALHQCPPTYNLTRYHRKLQLAVRTSWFEPCSRLASRLTVEAMAGERPSSQQSPDVKASRPKVYNPGNAPAVVQNTNKQMGYRNNWHRREMDLKDRVEFTTTLGKQPTVAIIGGGLSGLVCAQELVRLGIAATVFDTGEHGVGGRLATRTTRDSSLGSAEQTPESGPMAFDHAAQYFTVTDPRFQALVDEWVQAGVVHRWDGPVGQLRKGQFTPATNEMRYVGSRGMRSIAEHLASSLLKEHKDLAKLVRPMWVNRLQYQSGGKREAWSVLGRGEPQGRYDAVVIAHNGKCANRLVAPAGSPYVAQQLMQLRLSAVWALCVAFDQPFPVPGSMEGAFIQGSPVLSWAGNNSAKMRLRHPSPGYSCWTLISTKAYGKSRKVPQEAVPAEVAALVVRDMVAAFEAALGLEPGTLPEPVFAKPQLWGAALPLNTLASECVFDPVSRMGICGDWVLGGSMEAAAVSGIALAHKISDLRGRDPKQGLADLETALQSTARELGATDLGEFPRPRASHPAAPAAAGPSGSTAQQAVGTAGPSAARPQAAGRDGPADRGDLQAGVPGGSAAEWPAPGEQGTVSPSGASQPDRLAQASNGWSRDRTRRMVAAAGQAAATQHSTQVQHQQQSQLDTEQPKPSAPQLLPRPQLGARVPAKR